jgi:MOB kinase activator 1
MLMAFRSGDMRLAVQQPVGEDKNEWLAVHTVDCYNELSLLVGTVAESITDSEHPSMTVKGFEFRWADKAHPTPVSVSAREYIDFVLTWVEAQINDENIFPTSVDVEFPEDFHAIVGSMMKRMWRIFAFLYEGSGLYEAFKSIKTGPADNEVPASRHLHTCCKHFVFFVLEFNLVPEAELDIMKDLVDTFIAKEQAAHGAAAAAGAAAK